MPVSRTNYKVYDGILHYNGDSDSGKSHADVPQISWKIKQDGKWFENEAGVSNYPIQAIAIDLKGNGWYQVCTVKHGWLECVYGYNTNDNENGFAGYEDSPIVAVRCHYETPESTDVCYKAKYRVSDLGKDWQDFVYSDRTAKNKRDYAGNMVPIDRFEIELAQV